MTRRMRTILTALSLLLLATVVALWARSQFRADHITYHGEISDGTSSLWLIDLYTGTVRVYWAHYRFPPAEKRRFAAGARGGKLRREWSWRVMYYDDPRYTPDWAGRLTWNFTLPRLQSVRDPRTAWWGVEPGTLVTRTAKLPFWVLSVAFAALPLARAARRVRNGKRVTLGLCTACGYDLRATPGRCPECGASANEHRLAGGLARRSAGQ